MSEHSGILNFAFPEQPAKESATEERRLRLHEIRDGQAALLQSSALGLHCRDVFINNPYPSTCSLETQEKDIRRRYSDFSTILVSTRPPLDDSADRRRIKRSDNWLEKVILFELGTIFK